MGGAASPAPPERVEISYDITRNGTLIAEALYLLQHDRRTYRITETPGQGGAGIARHYAAHQSRTVSQRVLRHLIHR